MKQIQSLRFEGVGYKHPGHEPILNNCDFDFPMDRILWLKSTEEGGKSTMMQILAGLLAPQSGRYLINEKNVAPMDFEEFLPLRLKIGYAFDYGGLLNNRTLFENLMLPLEYHQVCSYDQAKKRVESIFERFDMVKFKNERPAHVPGRLRKWTCLLRATVLQPDVLVLDDPSMGLSMPMITCWVDMINEMRQQGYCSNVCIATYDEKMMEMLNYELLHSSEGLLYHQADGFEKKAVSI